MITQRIYLRERTPELIDKLLQLSVKDQIEFLGFDELETLNFELKNIKKNIDNPFDTRKKWDLVDIKSQKVIGNCGFHNWYIEHERAEIGYFMSQDFREKGYMGEALKCVIKYGFEELKLNRIEAFMSPTNIPSINTIKKLGFSKEGILREHYKWNNKIYDSIAYSLLKSEYN